MAAIYPDFPERSGLFREIRGALMKTIDFASAPYFLLALSGGLDSVFLFYFLVWLRAREGFAFSAAHFNHHLRPLEDEADSDFVRRLCQDYAVPLKEGEGDISELSRERGGGVEEAARFARYAFFERCLSDEQENVPLYLCLAHQQNDQAETLLLHLSRGAGLSGLAGMRPLEGRKLRPLLGLSRERMQAFMKERGLEWREDSSNAEHNYMRNRIRHELLPLWEQICGGRLQPCLARAAQNLGREEAWANEAARALLDSLAQGPYLQYRGLAKLQEAAAYRVLTLWLCREVGFRGLTERQFQTIWKLLRARCEGSLNLEGGLILRAAPPLLRLELPKCGDSGKRTPGLL